MTATSTAPAIAPINAATPNDLQRAWRADTPAAPTVEIHIGRIDVRGTVSPAAPAAPRVVAAPRQPARSLEDVLANRRSAT